jgi:hypothetical protein
MADPIYTFDRAGMEKLVRDHQRLRQQVHNLETRLRARSGGGASRMRVAQVPAAGIEARDGTNIPEGSCEVYRLLGDRVVSQAHSLPVRNAGSGASGGLLAPVLTDDWGFNWLIGQWEIYPAITNSSGITARSSTAPGSGSVTLLHVTGAGVLAPRQVNGANQVIAVNNMGSEIPASVYVLVLLDWYGTYWILYLRKHGYIQFTLDESLADTDQTVSVQIERAWGEVDVTLGATVTAYNHDTSAAGTYIFSGASGAWGTAVWDDINNRWRIIQMECP